MPPTPDMPLDSPPAPHVVAARERKLKALLAPEAAPAAKLGRNIAANQPDVEVLALALRRVPCTREAFDAAKPAEKDWVFVQFCVIGVGPPGFSSVPYSSTKKKGERDADAQPLYAASSKGTVFHTFAKGRTNKDRGRRVEEVDGAPVSAVLQPGVCVTMFLREEAFEGGKTFVGASDMIAENAFVFLQVGVSNAEQAAQGRLLKIKRVMPATDIAVVSALLGGMPASAEEHDSVMTESNELYPALSKCTIVPSVRVHTVALTKTAYAAAEGDGATLVSDDQAFYVGPRVLAECLPACNPARARKLLSLALAMQAVTVLVRRSREDVLSEKPTDEVVHMALDASRMLSLHALADGAPSMHTMWHGSEVWWSDYDKSIVMPGDQEFSVAWAMQTEPRVLPEARCDRPPGFLSDGCPGAFHRLRAYMFAGLSFEDFVRSEDRAGLAISLQLRPGMRGQGGGCGKRKREMVVADEFDESDSSE
jgi:hypothetical protein